jgi:hypothetical protein
MMKRKALDSFETLSKQLLNPALELAAAQEKKEGATQKSTIRLLRRELIVMLDGILRSLSRIFKL